MIRFGKTTLFALLWIVLLVNVLSVSAGEQQPGPAEENLENSSLYASSKNNEWKEHIRAAKAAQEGRDYVEAEKHLTSALKQCETFGRNDARVAYCLLLLGAANLEQEKFAEAETRLMRAAEIRKKIYGQDDAGAKNLNSLLALVSLSQGKPTASSAGAGRFMREAYGVLGIPVDFNDATISKLMSSDGKPIGDTKTALDKCVMPEWRALIDSGKALFESGKYGEAEIELRKSLKVAESTAALDGNVAVQISAAHSVAISKQNIAAVLMVQRKYKEAEPLLRQSLRQYDEILVPQNSSVLQCCRMLARAEWKLGQFAESAKLYERLSAVESKLGLTLSMDEALDREIDGAYSAMFKHNYAVADETFNRRIKHDDTPRGQSALLRSLEGLRYSYLEQKKYKDAEPIARRIVEIYTKTLPPADPELNRALKENATILRKLGKSAEAAEMEKQSIGK